MSAAQAAELAGSAGDRGRCQAPELEQVVSGRDELPFGRAGRQAAALEAVDTPQDLGVGKDGLDDLLSAAIERLAFGGAKDVFDSSGLGALSWREPAWCGARTRFGRNDRLDFLVAQPGDLGRVPIAAVGEHDLQLLVDTGGGQDA